MVCLKEAIVFVTGGAQGIGRSFVEHLLAEGATVAIGDLKTSVGEDTQRELDKKYPGKIIFLHCDVTNSKEFEEAINTAIKKLGQINMLINNAGICNESDNAWETMLSVNITGVVTGTKLGFKYMSKENGGNGGQIINVASITTLTPWDPVPVYCASKAFVNHFSRSYGRPLHYDQSGVEVMAINPGLTDTAILENAARGLLKDTASVRDSFSEFLEKFPTQAVDNMGRGLITMLRHSENGSMWLVENDEPAKKFTFEYKQL